MTKDEKIDLLRKCLSEWVDGYDQGTVCHTDAGCARCWRRYERSAQALKLVIEQTA